MLPLARSPPHVGVNKVVGEELLQEAVQAQADDLGGAGLQVGSARRVS